MRPSPNRSPSPRSSHRASKQVEEEGGIRPSHEQNNGAAPIHAHFPCPLGFVASFVLELELELLLCLLDSTKVLRVVQCLCVMVSVMENQKPAQNPGVLDPKAKQASPMLLFSAPPQAAGGGLFKI